MEYKPYLIKEIFICIKHINMTYKDVMDMPVYERRMYIGHLTEEVEYQNKQVENQNNKSSSSGGGGKRTRRVST